ncbi:unnamed protein product [Sphagnum jensenii]|uniref:Uncharacterized protein n=1 Tax=Sphagnum jensenii TaxID=128206 RepID=A0ABP0WMJ2_9BRYO
MSDSNAQVAGDSCSHSCLISSHSLHGGRGALPSEGGRPSDLSALAGGGVGRASSPFSHLQSDNNKYTDFQQLLEEGGVCGIF